jgi:hypothetical protein
MMYRGIALLLQPGSTAPAVAVEGTAIGARES